MPVEDDELDDAYALSLPTEVSAVAAAIGLPRLSPLERQVVELKAGAVGCLLLVEVGYMWITYGEDAVAAAACLNIGCSRKKHLRTASFPTARLHAHLPRLLWAGHRVAVAAQAETAEERAAAAEPQHGGFKREITRTYTLGTYAPPLAGGSEGGCADDADGGGGGGSGAGSESRVVMAVHERAVDARTSRLGVVAVEVHSGRVLHEEWEDALPRAEAGAAGASSEEHASVGRPRLRGVLNSMAMRGCAMRCCAVLCCAMRCCAVLCDVVLCREACSRRCCPWSCCCRHPTR